MLTIPGQQTVFNGVPVAQLFVFSVVICRSVCRFVPLFLTCPFRFTASNYPFGIYKLF